MTTHVYTRLPNTRGNDAKPLSAALYVDGVSSNMLAEMEQAPDAMVSPLINGAFTSSQTAYNGASCFWRTNFVFARASRVRLLRPIRFYFRARITAGAGTGTIRVWASKRWFDPLRDVPGAVPDGDTYTASVAGITGGNAKYEVLLELPDDAITRTAYGGKFGEEMANYPVTYLGAQLIVSAGATTAEVSRIARNGEIDD